MPEPREQEPEAGARAVARILHGLGSPAFPAKQWSSNAFWGRYTTTDFAAVLRAARANFTM